MTKKISVFCLLLVVMALSSGCPLNDPGNGVFSCVYEEQKSTACNSSSLTPWTSLCQTVTGEIRDDLTPQSYCDLVYPPSDTECLSGCCKSYYYRNVAALPGTCEDLVGPGEGGEGS